MGMMQASVLASAEEGSAACTIACPGGPPLRLCSSATDQPPDEVDAALGRAKAEYELTGRRSKLLGDRLCADPSWNILLDLFISRCSERPLSVTAVCIGSRSPNATALRHLECLKAAGLIARTADERDGRRTLIELTDAGWRTMVDLLRPVRA